MTEEAKWLQAALRNQTTAAQIVDLLNQMEPDTIDAQIYGPGFRISGYGGNFHVDSLLSDNDRRHLPSEHPPTPEPTGP